MKRAKLLYYWRDDKGNKNGTYEYRGHKYDVDFDGFLLVTVAEQHKYEQARIDDILKREEESKGSGEDAYDGLQKFWDYIDGKIEENDF